MAAAGSPPVREETVELVNRHGLHLRPATRFATAAQRFRSEIRVRCGADEANGKSTLMLSCLAAGPGARLVIRAEGDDADEAVAALAGLVRGGFEEAAGA